MGFGFEGWANLWPSNQDRKMQRSQKVNWYLYRNGYTKNLGNSIQIKCHLCWYKNVLLFDCTFYIIRLTIIFSEVSIEIKLQKGASFMADVIHRQTNVTNWTEYKKTELIWRTDSPSKTSEFGATAIFENTYISGG